MRKPHSLSADAGLLDPEQVVPKADIVPRLLRSAPETTVYDSVPESEDDATGARRPSCVSWSLCL